MVTPNISDKSTTAQPPKLLDQVRDKLRVKHYSIRTEQAYSGWIKRFIYFHGKRYPKEMGAQEIEAFLTYLEQEKGQIDFPIHRAPWEGGINISDPFSHLLGKIKRCQTHPAGSRCRHCARTWLL